MPKEKRPIRLLLIGASIVLLIFLAMQPFLIFHFRDYIDILFPKGIVALEERNQLLSIQALMLLIVVPVYILTFVFCWRYRAGNKKATYDPDLIDSHLLEYVWWGLPLVMTLIVSWMTWHKTHELDPYKPLVSDRPAKTIQVVALQWKWLFIYPEEGIATVNFVQFPRSTPIHFEITADAPMNSFWIPQLGGQIYAMPNMKTELYLMANQAGEFRGASANLSGEGFAGMHFMAKATSDDEYATWVAETVKSSESLDFASYTELAKPSSNNPVAVYQLKDDKLFDQVMMKYMHPIPKE